MLQMTGLGYFALVLSNNATVIPIEAPGGVSR